MQLILLNKPFRVLSQFTDADGRPTLGDFVKIPDVYGIGRLDYDSEGLILLTDDGRLKHQIAHPKFSLPKHYWVQVEGDAGDDQLQRLISGVISKGQTLNAVAARRIVPPVVWPRVPPIRERKSVPDCWLEIVLDQGRNRQVRRMTASVGLPTLRLIRHQIGPWRLHGLQPGETHSLHAAEAHKALQKFRQS